MLKLKAPRRKPLVVVVGTFQRGKSTLINGLIGHAVAEVGDGLATTHGWTRYRTGKNGAIEAVAPDGRVLHQWPGFTSSVLQHVDLADLPGFNAGGIEGIEDDVAAEEALLHAEIILYVTNQSGLSHVAERTSLIRAGSKQPFLIGLQNIFGQYSVNKKADWLENMEKHLNDMGITAWRLSSNARPLSINALRLAEAEGVAPYDESTPNRPLSDLEASQWRKESGVEPLIDFLTSNNPHGLGAVELCDIRHATTIWAEKRSSLINNHLEEFIKSCQ